MKCALSWINYWFTWQKSDHIRARKWKKTAVSCQLRWLMQCSINLIKWIPNLPSQSLDQRLLLWTPGEKIPRTHAQDLWPNALQHTLPFTNMKKQEQMSKQSIFAILTGLFQSHLPYTIYNHEHFSSFMQLYKSITTQFLAFPQPCDLELTSRSSKLEPKSRV